MKEGSSHWLARSFFINRTGIASIVDRWWRVEDWVVDLNERRLHFHRDLRAGEYAGVSTRVAGIVQIAALATEIDLAQLF